MGLDGSFITTATPTFSHMLSLSVLTSYLIAFWELQTVMSCKDLYISERQVETQVAPLSEERN